MTSAELQRLLLQTLAKPGTDARLGRGQHYLAEALRAAAPENDRPRPHQVQEAIWALVAQGLAYLDISQSAPENWRLQLTSNGEAALSDRTPNPDDPEGYLHDLAARVPELGSTSRLYLREALDAYFNRLYIASTVMLGVAAEAAFYDLAFAAAGSSLVPGASTLTPLLASPKVGYFRKFEEVRKRLLPILPSLPQELRDGFDIQLNAVFDLLRVARNDAGHPTGLVVTRDDAFVNLRVFPRAASRLYAVRAALTGT